jgi:indolepyruvate ferredoxin oxidoreductase
VNTLPAGLTVRLELISMAVDLTYELADRFTRTDGNVHLTGVDALVRLPLDQARRDRAAGITTEGFISGYRGSPLGTYDMALERATRQLEREGVHFEPGLNEDLAATAVWGTQQSALLPDCRVDGVFGLWYGKGPGVDRSVDALKHGNYAGASPHGGVLVVAGDDPGAKSSSLAHASGQALMHCAIPVLEPSTPQEIIDYGLYGWALSRYAGCWVGLRIVTDVVESAGTVDASGIGRWSLKVPDDDVPPGHHIAWNRSGAELERMAVDVRLPLVSSFARANAVDGVAFGTAGAARGIVAAGKAYLDLREALAKLGIDDAGAAELGLAIYKVGMSWPLEPTGITEFARGCGDLLVVEEKGPLLENQVAAILYRSDHRPRLAGKTTADGKPLLPKSGELSPATIAAVITSWLELPTQNVSASAPRVLRSRIGLPLLTDATPLVRKAAFCSGCPHSASTVVPAGSIAFGGIGCHGMATYMPERNTLSLTQMGGEGATWIGMNRYTATPHVFQNMGDGTFFHSGLLAVRAAVAAGVNITYKVLANGAVAMTGGQEIEGHTIDSTPLVADIVAQLRAAGVAPLVVVSDQPETYHRGTLPAGVDVVHRDELHDVQERLAARPGVTALVYDQTCAAEARRLRKRGEFRDLGQRVIINELVCEGCGDCGAQSNCIAIEPVETEFGRKRAINQHACNLDFSCVKGYCPSFAIVSGGKVRAATFRSPPDAVVASLPLPESADATTDYNVLIGGIGGTGVITAGALVAMAAHLEGKQVTSLDVTGLAQKNGSVSSHIRVSAAPGTLHSARITAGMADLVIGSDIVVTGEPAMLAAMAAGRTAAVLNLDVVPTADFALHPDLDLRADPYESRVRQAIGDEATILLEARLLARTLLRDELGMNTFLLGFALQRGLLPVGVESLERAIELNGVGAQMNKAAVAWGRLAAHDLAAALRLADADDSSPTTDEQDLAAIVRTRMKFLEAYQNRAYAATYEAFVSDVSRAEHAAVDGGRLARAVAISLFKLMAYKDEYEVARLYTDGSFARQVAEQFEGDFRVKLNLAPQQFFPVDRRTGRPKKITFGPWIFPALRVLRGLKFLRGTRFDVVGSTAHRRAERALIAQYREDVTGVLPHLSQVHDLVVELAEIPQSIRGFGAVKDETMRSAAEHRMRVLAAITEMTLIGGAS